MLLDKALSTQITCSDSPGLPVDQVLKRWSQSILKEYMHQSRLASLSVMDEPGKEVYSAMASLADSVKALTMSNEALIESNRVLEGKVNSMSDQFNALVQQHAEDKSTISSLHVGNKELREEVRRMAEIEALRSQHLMLTPQGGLSTTPRRRAKKRMRDSNIVARLDIATEEESDTVDDEEGGGSVAAVPPSTPSHPSTTTAPATFTTPTPVPAPVPAPAPAPMATHNNPVGTHRNNTHHATRNSPRPLQLRACNQVTTGAAESMKNRMLSDALVLLAQQGLLRLPKKLEHVNLPAKVFSEKHFMTNCLELADYVAQRNPDVKDSINIMRNSTMFMDQVEIADAANKIVMACEQQLDEFVPPRTKRRLDTTITGMGSRIKNYKQRIKTAKNFQGHLCRVGLISLEELTILEERRQGRT